MFINRNKDFCLYFEFVSQERFHEKLTKFRFMENLKKMREIVNVLPLPEQHSLSQKVFCVRIIYSNYN